MIKKRRCVKVIALTAFALLCQSPGPANAEINAGTQILNFHIGGALAQNKTALTAWTDQKPKVAVDGIQLDGQYIYSITTVLGIGGAISYSNGTKRYKDLPAGAGKGKLTNWANAVKAEAIIRCVLLPSKKVYPYIIGGVGFGKASVSADAKPMENNYWVDTGTTESRKVYNTVSIYGLSYSYGVGIEGAIGKGAIAGMAIRWSKILGKKTVKNSYINSGSWEFKDSENILLTASIGVKFGK